MLGGAAPAPAEHAARVRVVHAHHRVVPLRELEDVGQLRDVAFHREDAVGDDQSRAPALRLDEPRLEVRHVGVLVDRRLALGDRLGEPDAVDDGRVVQLVGDDDVVLAEDRRRQALVRVPARHVGQ